MIYVQVKGGKKFHLAYEAGEGCDDMNLVKVCDLHNAWLWKC